MGEGTATLEERARKACPMQHERMGKASIGPEGVGEIEIGEFPECAGCNNIVALARTIAEETHEEDAKYIAAFWERGRDHTAAALRAMPLPGKKTGTGMRITSIDVAGFTINGNPGQEFTVSNGVRNVTVKIGPDGTARVDYDPRAPS